MKSIILLLMFLLVIGLATAGPVSIKSVSTSQDIGPGEIAEVSISLENQGKSKVENILVSLDLKDAPFIPVNSAAEKLIDELNKNDIDTLTFSLKSLPEAKPGLYKIPVKISYENTVQETVIGISIKAAPELDIAIEETTLYIAESKGEVTVRVVNRGLTEAKFLNVKLFNSVSYDIISSDSFYIGSIEPDDFETVVFELFLKEPITSLNIQIEYKDLNNNLIQENVALPMTIYSREEALKIGLIQESNAFLTIIIIIALIALIFLYRRYKKNKKLREAMQ